MLYGFLKSILQSFKYTWSCYWDDSIIGYRLTGSEHNSQIVDSKSLCKQEYGCRNWGDRYIHVREGSHQDMGSLLGLQRGQQDTSKW